jgi:hypothetical protein
LKADTFDAEDSALTAGLEMLTDGYIVGKAFSLKQTLSKPM